MLQNSHALALSNNAMRLEPALFSKCHGFFVWRYVIIFWTYWFPQLYIIVCISILGWKTAVQDRGVSCECFQLRSFYFVLFSFKISSMLFSKLCTLFSVLSHFRFLLLPMISNFHLIMTACFRHNVVLFFFFMFSSF